MISFSPAPDFSTDDGVAFSVTSSTPSDLRLDQFVSELTQAHGWKEPCNVNYFTGDGVEGWVLWISRKDVDLVKLKTVGKNHRRDDKFRPPQAADPSTPNHP